MKQHRYYPLGRVFTSHPDHRVLVLCWYTQATPRVKKRILWVQDLKYHMQYTPDNDKPTDWNPRRPDPTENQTSEERCKHDLTMGINNTEGIRKLDKILEGRNQREQTLTNRKYNRSRNIR